MYIATCQDCKNLLIPTTQGGLRYPGEPVMVRKESLSYLEFISAAGYEVPICRSEIHPASSSVSSSFLKISAALGNTHYINQNDAKNVL